MNITSSFPNSNFDKTAGWAADVPPFIPMGTRVLCLYRVSTDKQLYFTDKNDADIPMQRIRCHEFCERMGWTIVCELQEEGISGYKVRAEKRDKIQLIKDYAKQKRFDILLVFMFDRLGRIADETPFLVEWFVRNGIRVWSTQEGEQRFESHADKLMNYIRFWQADGESEKTSIRTSNSMGILAEQGFFTGGVCAYGYKLVKLGRTNKRKQEVCDLEVCPEEAQVVRMLFNLAYYEGYGAQRIANYFNAKGLKNREGKNWHPSSIKGMMRNVLYIGILRSGERRSGVIERLRIVDETIFNSVQEMLRARSRQYEATRSEPLHTKGRTLLAGNVFCGHCGARLCLTTNGKGRPREDGTDSIRIRYCCQTRTRTHGDCDGQTGYTARKLDGVIEALMRDIFSRVQRLTREEVLDACYRTQLQERQGVAKKIRSDYNKAENDLQYLKTEIVKAITGSSDFSPAVLNRAILEQEQKCNELRMALNDAEQAIHDVSLQGVGMDSQYDSLLEWANAFDLASPSAKKVIVSRIIERVDVYRDYRLVIKFRLGIDQFLTSIDSTTDIKDAAVRCAV